MLCQKELIINNIDAGKLTLGIFIDYSKAFDRLNHQILISKLEGYGIRGVANLLFQSYLSGRTQCVAIEKYCSSYREIKSGVPQGSVLGPILFNIYVNDLAEIVSDASIVQYADDTSLFVSGHDLDDLLLRSRSILCNLSAWSRNNALTINCSKSKAILFRARGRQSYLNQELFLDGAPIETLSKYKVLGVTLSEDMNWTYHIELVMKSLSSAAGVLSRCRHFFPEKVRLQIYHALFESHLNYCALVWATTTKHNIHALLQLQKRALRHVANLPYFHSTAQLLNKYNIIRV